MKQQMPPDQRMIPESDIDTDSEQPRTHFDSEDLLPFGHNMLSVGQLIAIIVVWVEATKRYICIDGERRLRAARLVGIKQLLAVVLSDRPSPAELRAIQASIALHRKDLLPSEKAELLSRMQQDNNCTISEVCKQLQFSQSTGSKLMSIRAADPALLSALDAGKIGVENAYILSTEPDRERQKLLLEDAAALPREQLRKRVRSPQPGEEPKSAAATFRMPGQYQISLRGSEMTLTTAIEVLSECVKLLKKGLAQNLDIRTQVRAMADSARAIKHSS